MWMKIKVFVSTHRNSYKKKFIISMDVILVDIKNTSEILFNTICIPTYPIKSKCIIHIFTHVHTISQMFFLSSKTENALL